MVLLIEVDRLDRWHDVDGEKSRILQAVSLTVQEAEFVTVMGPSGSGKSTLLHCISGMDRPDGGMVKLGVSEIFAVSERERTLIRRKFLGFVFQFFNLLPDLTVRENIELPLLIAGDRPEHQKHRIDDLLGVLDLSRLHARLPHSLSGGEMQRVSIARALSTRPPLLLADEPTGNLSSKAGEQTMQLFKTLSDRFGTAILLVTHNPRDAAFGDRVLFLKDGCLDPDNSLEGSEFDAATVFARLEALGI